MRYLAVDLDFYCPRCLIRLISDADPDAAGTEEITCPNCGEVETIDDLRIAEEARQQAIAYLREALRGYGVQSNAGVRVLQ